MEDEESSSTAGATELMVKLPQRMNIIPPLQNPALESRVERIEGMMETVLIKLDLLLEEKEERSSPPVASPKKSSVRMAVSKIRDNVMNRDQHSKAEKVNINESDDQGEQSSGAGSSVTASEVDHGKWWQSAGSPSNNDSLPFVSTPPTQKRKAPRKSSLASLVNIKQIFTGAEVAPKEEEAIVDGRPAKDRRLSAVPQQTIRRGSGTGKCKMAVVDISGTIPPYLLLHTSRTRGRWDLMVVLLVLWVAFQVPFSLSFGVKTPQMLDLSFDFIFFADMCLNFRTSYVDRMSGETVVDPRRIARRYMRSIWFAIDFFSCLPLEHMLGDTDNENSSGTSTAIVKALKLARMIRMGKLFKKMDDLLAANAFRMVKLLGFIILMIHWIACLWFGAADEWHTTANVENESLYTQYTASAYASVSLLFRNIHQVPSTERERMIATCVVILGACIQASVFGSVAVLLAGIDEDEMRYQKKLIDVSRRMKQLELPSNVRDRVMLYYEMLWLRQKSVSKDADKFITELSPALRTDVRLSLFSEMMRKIPFFNSKDVSSLVVEALVMVLQTRTYLEGDLIMRRGESGDWMGFVGSAGRVGILDPSVTEGPPKIIRVLGMGEYVGEMALLLQMRRTANVKALTWLRLHVLTSEGFRAVKARYPEEIAVIERNIEDYRNKKNYKHNDKDAKRLQELEEQKVGNSLILSSPGDSASIGKEDSSSGRESGRVKSSRTGDKQSDIVKWKRPAASISSKNLATSGMSGKTFSMKFLSGSK